MAAKQPAALAALRGTPRLGAGDLVAVKALTRVPDPMTDLGPTAERCYNEAASALIEAGVLTRLDVPALTAWAIAYGNFLDATADYLANPTVKGARGNQVRSPQAAFARDSLAQATALGKQLGLSPASRKGLTTSQDPDGAGPEDDLERILSSGPPGVA